jgi:Abnormal spindle-like microcephaly-assoc'd, ASPM-SPD-2-Hydin
MFFALLSSRRATNRCGSEVPGVEIRPASSQPFFDRASNSRLTYSVLGLSALCSLLALGGCGGLEVNPKSSALSALSCSSAAVSGAGTDSCTVTLNLAAPTGGVEVALRSSSSAVTVPTMVTVPAQASTVNFTATFDAVTSAQTVTLTSVASGINKTFALRLSPEVAGGTGNPTLTVNASSVTFGNVALGTPSTQSLTLSSTGGAAVTVASASLSGTGFTDSGVTFPLTLNAGQSATLNLQFVPTAAGAATGQLTINSNSTSHASYVIPLSGTGVPLAIALNWDAPSGTTVNGYNVYRAIGSSSSFQKLNSSLNTPDSYTDSSIQPNTTYAYYVTSVDSSGTESAPSNTATVDVP